MAGAASSRRPRLLPRSWLVRLGTMALVQVGFLMMLNPVPGLVPGWVGVYSFSAAVLLGPAKANSETGAGPPPPRPLAGNRALSLTRQYSELSRLCHPPRLADRATSSDVASAEKHRARTRAAQYFKHKHEFEARCFEAAKEEARRFASELNSDHRGKGLNATRDATTGDHRVRWYLTSKRKDFEGYVAEELHELGLCEAAANQSRGNVDIYMGEQFDSENAPWWARNRGARSRVFKRGAAVGSIDGLMALFGQKDSYARMYRHCERLAQWNSPRAALCPAGWLPSFNVHGASDRRDVKFKKGRVDKADVPEFDPAYALVKNAAALPMVWIVKPQKGTFLSRGMHLSSLDETDAATKTNFLNWISRAVLDEACLKPGGYDPALCDRRRVTFQLYVHKPALYHDRKFDIRLWFALTSLDPLRVFALRHGYPKVASRPFDLDQLDDQCRHIKMLLDPACNVTIRDFRADFPYPYPRSTASPNFFAGLRFPALAEAVRKAPAARKISRSSSRYGTPAAASGRGSSPLVSARGTTTKKGASLSRGQDPGPEGESIPNARRRIKQAPSDRRRLLTALNASALPNKLARRAELRKTTKTGAVPRRASTENAERAAIARTWPMKEQFWSRHVWPSIEGIFSKIVMLARSNLTSPEALVVTDDRKVAPKTKIRSRSRSAKVAYRPFALLSPDVTLDDKGRVYVEEINTNGLVMGTHTHGGGGGNLFFDDAYVRAFLRILGADGYPRQSKYASTLEAAIRAFCDPKAAGDDARDDDDAPCTDADRQAFRQAVHEEAHAGPHWYRLYPPISCFVTRPNSTLDCVDVDPNTGQGAWPNQARLDDADFAAMPETALDRRVRAFLATTDTAAIHGVPQVPGHGRWPPRDFDGTSSI